jgi:hypothetical protein
MVLLAAAGVLGCSSANDDGCRVPLSELQCKPTFDQQVEWGRTLNPSYCPTAGPCGAYRLWVYLTISSLSCVYDDSGQTLLSGADCSDVPLACGHGNDTFCMTGGQSIELSKECDVTALPSTCAPPP